jgi:hypothetical protein
MKKLFISIIILLTAINAIGQTKITGIVSDKHGETLPGANIYFLDSYDGTSSDTSGRYNFITELSGTQTLIVSFIGYKNFSEEIILEGRDIELIIILKENNNQLDAVVISAGSFEAGDQKKAVVLKPLDIVTTAGGLGDIYGALNTLPGTQTVGEDGRIFVRGGDGYETKTFIDGMLVENPYSSKMPDVPVRGRFSPFLFSGTMFSTGGYSAEYGQAMSSALILNTNDLPPRSVSSISLMSVGAGFSHTKRWKRSSVSAEANYLNLAPYYNLINQDFDWKTPPMGIGGNVIARKKTGKNGLIKFFGSFSHGKSQLSYPDFNNIGNKNNIGLINDNSYLNLTYGDILSKKWISKAGISFSFNNDNTDIDLDNFMETDKTVQVKYTLTHLLSEEIKIKFGSDLVNRNYSQKYFDFNKKVTYKASFNDNISSVFAETEVALGSKFAARAGSRFEYSSLLSKINLAPRISLACKTGKKSQVSFAYGKFFQNPQNNYLVFNNDLDFESASHYIFNYQLIKNDRVFRIEAYYKKYHGLVKYDSLHSQNPESYNNTGNGYAKGIDVFWRDNKTINNVEYWISYSFIDTERNYLDYPESATPTFVSTHNLSTVVKWYVPILHTQFGATYSFSSGRTYFNPNNPDFLSDKTGSYNNLSLNVSYLTNIFKKFTIIYFSVGNIFGVENIYGYHYSTKPNTEGVYKSFPVKSGAKRFVFLGVFISI